MNKGFFSIASDEGFLDNKTNQCLPCLNYVQKKSVSKSIETLKFSRL